MSARDRAKRQLISLDDLLRAYSIGYFPMADSRDDPRLYWVSPDQRGVLPLKTFHVPRTLRKLIRRNIYTVRINTAFEKVLYACAAPARGRENTWINDNVISLYKGLHERGAAHSVECWLDDALVGGLYGVSMGAAFFGESMFYRASGASQVALAHLVGRLTAGGYSLLDTQFKTDHLARFGVVEMNKEDYLVELRSALDDTGDFFALPENADGQSILQSIIQTS